MSKQLFFLVGMPRSGNTLFGSLINQNPAIACTANSITYSVIANLLVLKQQELFQNYPDHQSLNNVIESVYDNYYKDWPQDYIIDRSNVTAPGTYDVFRQHFKQPFKYIVLLRDMEDILASYIKWFETEPSSFVNHFGWNTIEDKLNMLLDPNGAILHGLSAIKTASQMPESCFFLKYSDLVKDTQNQFKQLYEFLEIPLFEHDFENIAPFSVNGMKYDDNAVGKNMHRVSKTIEAKQNDYKKMIPKRIRDQYCHIRF